jgi:hypothetical protein
VSSICPGFSIRPHKGQPGRRPSHLVNAQPIAAVADSLAAKPAVLELLRRIDGIRGDCDESIAEEPAMQELLSRQLARFYSSYKRRRPVFKVYVLSKGDLVLDELDRRARLAATDLATQASMLSLVEPDMEAIVGKLDAMNGPAPRRSRLKHAGLTSSFPSPRRHGEIRAISRKSPEIPIADPPDAGDNAS